MWKGASNSQVHFFYIKSYAEAVLNSCYAMADTIVQGKEKSTNAKKVLWKLREGNLATPETEIRVFWKIKFNSSFQMGPLSRWQCIGLFFNKGKIALKKVPARLLVVLAYMENSLFFRFKRKLYFLLPSMSSLPFIKMSKLDFS